jgi:hypothetical protein
VLAHPAPSLMNYTCYKGSNGKCNIILSKPKQDKKNSRSFHIGCSDFGKVTPSRTSYSSTLKRLEGTRQEDALVYEYNISGRDRNIAIISALLTTLFFKVILNTTLLYGLIPPQAYAYLGCKKELYENHGKYWFQRGL